MLQRLTFVLAIVLVIGYGLLEGAWTERWVADDELRQAADKLKQIPATVGTWESEDRELDERQVRQGEIRASLYRVYTDTASGSSVTVLLVAGRAGPISVHAPETCLGGSGFALKSPAVTGDVPCKERTEKFWHGVFRKDDGIVPEDMELYWGWNPGAGWQAANSPRWDYARKRYLYKLYVSRPVPVTPDRNKDQEETVSPIPAFLEQLLPAVERTLFPAS